MRLYPLSNGVGLITQWQWQPGTLSPSTIDPNPPLPIEDPAVAQTDDPFNLTEGLDEGLENLGVDLSFYQQIDDDPAAGVDPSLVYVLDALDDQPEDVDLGYYQVISDDPVVQPDDLNPAPDALAADDLDQPDLSFYQTIDDDPIVVDPTLVYLLDASLDDDGAVPDSDYTVIADDVAVQPDDLQPLAGFDEPVEQDSPDLSFYQQIDDDAIGGQPDTLFGNFDFIDETGLFDETASFYYQQDDDAVVPPVIPDPGAGGVAPRMYVLSSRESDDRQPNEPRQEREPFEVRLEKPRGDLKQLSEKLFELGKQLGQNKQVIKDRIKAEQKSLAADLKAKDAKLLVMIELITLFELELHNQNARRLLLILAEDRP